ncbi:MAG: hypothetical protein HY667_06970 [Chloroflexi bacterium]|nr:hypothetical protein [Chloroflexota bacterium]
MQMVNKPKVGEVIEASTTGFIAECYELYQSPPLGSLVKTADSDTELYAVVCGATTASLEPGRRPIARGRGEVSEEEIYHANPQLTKLLRSEFSALVVGHKENGKIHHYLPPKPARIHHFIYQCSPEEVKNFSRSFAFLNILLGAHQPVSAEELVAACLRQMGQVQDDPHAFLVASGKELAVLLNGDFNRLKAILERIKQ